MRPQGPEYDPLTDGSPKARNPPCRPALRDGVIRPGGTCDPRALSCYTFEQGKSEKIFEKYAPAAHFGIPAGNGGDILSPQAEVPFFYPYGVRPFVQHGASLL